MQNLFFRNAPSIFVVLGTIYGLMLYINIPRGGTEAIFIATIVMLGYFFYSGKVIQQLYEKVYTDSLTGLKSRAGFEPMKEKRKGNAGDHGIRLVEAVIAHDGRRVARVAQDHL